MGFIAALRGDLLIQCSSSFADCFFKHYAQDADLSKMLDTELFEVYCTRIDLQKTFFVENLKNSDMLEFYTTVLSPQKVYAAKTYSSSASGAEDPLSTLYLGARTSPKMLRIYQKKKADLLRFELELKHEVSRGIFSSLLAEYRKGFDDENLKLKIFGLLGSFLRDFVEKIPELVNGVVGEALNKEILCLAGETHKFSRGKVDTQKTFEWFLGCCLSDKTRETLLDNPKMRREFTQALTCGLRDALIVLKAKNSLL